QTFDRALEQSRGGPDSLRLLHAATSLRVETLTEAGARRLASGGRLLGRARLHRLLQLAPAAIEWVDRHPGRIDPHAAEHFPAHLLRRCAAVLHDDAAPHCDEE